MKNVAKYLRPAYKTALTGITYNGENIPVYETNTSVTLPDYYIEILNVTDANVDNDAKFIREVNVDVEVFTKQYKYQNNNAVDEISEDATQAILSVIGGNLDTTAFQIGHINLSSSRYLYEEDNGHYITRKILSFTQLVTQK